jgi:Ca2+-binding EF-hand superfamily protein
MTQAHIENNRQRRCGAAAFTALLAACACGAAAAAGPWNGPQPERIFERLDLNSDGVVDRGELEAARHAAFVRADADRDGYITEAEAQALLQELRAQGAAGQRPLFRGRLAARRPAEQANVLARFDTNLDGRVSEAELVDPEHPFEALFDANSDGRITKSEVDRALASLRDR